MNDSTGKTLLLALGNDLLGDDGVGIRASRELAPLLPSDEIDVETTSEAGIVLMEIMTGYKRVLVMDSIMTREVPPGSIIELEPGDFQKVINPSPHYAGMPEILELAHHMEIPFPDTIKVLAIEVADPYEFRDHFTPGVEKGFPNYIHRAIEVLTSWHPSMQEKQSCTNMV